MFVCPECGHEFVDRDFMRITQPQHSNFIDNLLDLAGFLSGERSWDFYKQSRKDIVKAIDDSFLAVVPAVDKDESESAYEGWKVARANYFKLPEVSLIYGVNFCVREGSAYRLLKARLLDAIEDGTNAPFSLDDEYTRIKDMLTEAYGIGAAKDMLQGFKGSASTINRILLEMVPGSERVIHIKSCGVSDWFPECKKYEKNDVKSVFND